MSTCVCVLSNNGERLMPTIRLGRVRHLLKDGKAKIIKHHPFTIQLLYDSKTNTQPIEICEDVGYNYIGISVKSQSHEYVSAQYDTLQDEKACHDSCRKLRRTRRNRLRYRKPRFDNRKRGEGWLAPSLKHKKELNVNVVKYRDEQRACCIRNHGAAIAKLSCFRHFTGAGCLSETLIICCGHRSFCKRNISVHGFHLSCQGIPRLGKKRENKSV